MKRARAHDGLPVSGLAVGAAGRRSGAKARWIAALTGAGLAGAAELAVAAPVFQTVGQEIPEFPATGLGISSTINLAGHTELVGTVRVFLEVSGDYTGDLYFFLTHDSELAVLLNRVGRTTGSPFGYGDSGLNVTFEDAAPNGDVHGYRQVLSGDDNLALSGPLTGNWAPDGRLVNPGTVTGADSRSATLTVFGGASQNGDWTLFATDYEAGGTHRLDRWGIEFVPVPEPVEWGVAAAAWLFPSLLMLRRFRSPGGRGAGRGYVHAPDA